MSNFVIATIATLQSEETTKIVGWQPTLLTSTPPNAGGEEDNGLV